MVILNYRKVFNHSLTTSAINTSIAPNNSTLTSPTSINIAVVLTNSRAKKRKRSKIGAEPLNFTNKMVPMPIIPIVPDFVIELRSATDNLKPLQEKMLEYQRLGVKLGLLINPQNQQVEIYRPGQELEIVESSLEFDCSPVMPGFVLSLSKIW
jgi:hypothetical protein